MWKPSLLTTVLVVCGVLSAHIGMTFAVGTPEWHERTLRWVICIYIISALALLLTRALPYTGTLLAAGAFANAATGTFTPIPDYIRVVIGDTYYVFNIPDVVLIVGIVVGLWEAAPFAKKRVSTAGRSE